MGINLTFKKYAKWREGHESSALNKELQATKECLELRNRLP